MMEDYKLKSLAIIRGYYGKDAGKLTGSVSFENNMSEFTVKLSEEKATKILAVIAEQVKENGRELATAITSGAGLGLPALEGEVLGEVLNG